jgi:hypothetical protein
LYREWKNYLKIKNAVKIYDPDARWDYDKPEPEHREPTPSWLITLIFEGKEIINIWAK